MSSEKHMVVMITLEVMVNLLLLSCTNRRRSLSDGNHTNENIKTSSTLPNSPSCVRKRKASSRTGSFSHSSDSDSLYKRGSLGSNISTSSTNNSPALVQRLNIPVLLAKNGIRNSNCTSPASVSYNDTAAEAAEYCFWDDMAMKDTIYGQTVRSLKYLVTVTPPAGGSNMVKRTWEKVNSMLKRIKETGFISEEPPYFNMPERNPSPICENIYDVLPEMIHKWSTCPDRLKHVIINREDDWLKEQVCTSRNVFDIKSMRYGASTPRDPKAAAVEIQAVSTFATSILSDKTCLISIQQILQLHKCFDVEEGLKGAFRTTAAVGMVSNSLYRAFLPPGEIAYCVDSLVKTINMDKRMKSLHPYVIAYYFYTVFVLYIHPFHDGNGRVGRLICNIISRKLGYPDCIRANDKTIKFNDFIDKAGDAVKRNEKAAEIRRRRAMYGMS